MVILIQLILLAVFSPEIYAAEIEGADSSYVCPMGWIPSVVNGKCFRLITTKKANPTEASNWCRFMGATLATIESAHENDFVLHTIIGENSNDWVRIGGQASTNQRWEWEDGTPFQFTNWGENEPQVGGTTAFIINIESYKGGPSYRKWHASKAQNSHDFLCQLRMNYYEPDSPKALYSELKGIMAHEDIPTHRIYLTKAFIISEVDSTGSKSNVYLWVTTTLFACLSLVLTIYYNRRHFENCIIGKYRAMQNHQRQEEV